MSKVESPVDVGSSAGFESPVSDTDQNRDITKRIPCFQLRDSRFACKLAITTSEPELAGSVLVELSAAIAQK